MKKFASLLVIAVLSFSLVACSVDEVLADIDLALQMTASLETAIGGISPADAATLARLVAIASAGLAVIQQGYKDFEASGAQGDLNKVQAAALVLQANLALELAAAHITNPATTQKVSAWVNLVTTALDAVLQLSKQVHGAKPQTPAQMAALDRAAAPTVVTAKALHQRWQKEVCAGEKACGKLVTPRKIKRKKTGQGFLGSLGNAIGEGLWGGNR